MLLGPNILPLGIIGLPTRPVFDPLHPGEFQRNPALSNYTHITCSVIQWSPGCGTIHASILTELCLVPGFYISEMDGDLKTLRFLAFLLGHMHPPSLHEISKNLQQIHNFFRCDVLISLHLPIDDLLLIHTGWNMYMNFVIIQCLLIGWCSTTSPSAIPSPSKPHRQKLNNRINGGFQRLFEMAVSIRRPVEDICNRLHHLRQFKQDWDVNITELLSSCIVAPHCTTHQFGSRQSAIVPNCRLRYHPRCSRLLVWCRPR